MSETPSTPDDQPADSDAARETAAQEGDGDDGTGRRRLLRWIIGIAIGIPILLEVSTFLGLFREQLTGNDTPTRTPTAVPEGVSVGDDLLAETPQPDLLTAASISAVEGDTWPLKLTVEVENTGDVPYQFVLGEVTTREGTVVKGSVGTPQLQPGETAVIENTWQIPAGSQPERIVVEAFTYGEQTTRTKTAVRLSRIPVSG